MRETIYHSARTRLPGSWSNHQVNEYVDAVIETLGLKHVQYSLIGDESAGNSGRERGVSGGQRKRVNIGIGLASAPLALFLDEPTSGLDSTASLKVVSTLKAIAGLGVSVVTVLHQPRYEIFETFDDLLLLVPGGRTAYIGPCLESIQYFKSLGYEVCLFRKGIGQLSDPRSLSHSRIRQTFSWTFSLEIPRCQMPQRPPIARDNWLTCGSSMKQSTRVPVSWQRPSRPPKPPL